MSRTGDHVVNWNNLSHESAQDGLGRTFKWRELKGKTIFLCGHGAHFFRDGYTTVPPGTKINFYQTYGQLLLDAWVYRIIEKRKDEWLEPERTFSEGQSCPNMLLYEDDDDKLSTTDAAMKKRIANDAGASDSSFILNANQFNNLKYRPFRSTQRKILTLEDIFQNLPGNQFEWVCCQELTWKNTVTPKIAAGAIRSSAFAKNTDPALQAAEQVSNYIRKGYNKDSSVKIAKHSEGAGAFTASCSLVAGLEFNNIMASQPMLVARSGVNRFDPSFAGKKYTSDLKTIEALKKLIEQGLRDLHNETQPTASQYFQKRTALQIGLQQAEALLNSLRGAASYSKTGALPQDMQRLQAGTMVLRR